MSSKSLLPGLALLAVAGCLVGPSYRKVEPATPTSWNRLDPTATPSLRATVTADLARWWRALDDRLLSGLVDEALAASPSVRLARARLREGRARRSATMAGLHPTLAASASASRSSMPGAGLDTGSSNQLSIGFDASWELDLFGGVRRGIEAATADQERLVESLHDAQVSLVAEVARDYVEVRTLQIRLGIARDNLASQAETLQLTTWRAQTGGVSAQDVEQARSNHEQTRAQIPTLETSLAEAEHAIDVLLGKAPGANHARMAAGGSLPAIPARIAVGIPAATLGQRPDVRAAERTLAAETARVGVAEAARYPSFKLSGSIGIETITGTAIGGGSGGTYSLLGGITAPLFDAGRLRSQVEAQDAVREQAALAYEQTVLVALQEVENALVALAKNHERSAALDQAVAAAHNAAQLARHRYGAGLIDFQSVLDTQRTVLSLEDSLASTRADGVQALIRLYKAMGGGWSRPPPIDGTKDAT